MAKYKPGDRFEIEIIDVCRIEGKDYYAVRGFAGMSLFDEDNFKYLEKVEPDPLEVDWSTVPVDTPILVRDDEKDTWENRYFAEYRNGKVWAWDGGCTSWSADNHKCNWNFAKLAEVEND